MADHLLHLEPHKTTSGLFATTPQVTFCDSDEEHEQLVLLEADFFRDILVLHHGNGKGFVVDVIVIHAHTVPYVLCE